MVIRLLLPLVGLVASIATPCAHAPVALAEDNIDWPSPTGKFAFRTSDDEHILDLVDKKSGKKLQRIDV
jgi:hypothetical protein